MEDTLAAIVKEVQWEIKENFFLYLEAHPDLQVFNDYQQAQRTDSVFAVADSNAPIFTDEIKNIYSRHQDNLENAYRKCDIGDGKEPNHEQVAIFCYLEQEGNNAMKELHKWFENEYIPYRKNHDNVTELKAFIKGFQDKPS